MFKTTLFQLFSAAISVSALSSSIPWEKNGTFGHETLSITRKNNGSILRLNIQNGPINLYDAKLGTDMTTLLNSLIPSNIPSNAKYPPPKVIVFSSDNPDFWMGHYDLELLIPGRTNLTTDETNALFANAVATARLLSTLPTIFIAEINGHATGSGNEFLVQCDMAFAGPNAVVGSMEVAVGGLQGNGGIQFLVRKLGMAKAAEYLLAATSIGAQEAADMGWVNRAYGSAKELRKAVDALTYRLSILPAGALNGTKTAIRAFGPNVGQSDADVATILRLFPEEIPLLPRFLELTDNQTANAFELGALRDIRDVEKAEGLV
ncbi:ClpP/crotonase [Mytilinidion resinicola]|uniref:ClpP/crotonase n=1 Tax=Mytilinidion resinicola TaxID=574789 RepID=A0A6A6Y5I4_9PEZI|nr:ClpP/crotonase [Mytilinidion resinicola]KAF2803284.1 ClpP/crotonase [Mytilinidion resinicola]